MDYSNNPRLSQIPAARPPPGTLSNLVDPPTLEIPTITVNAILLSLALAVVALRVYTKHSLLRNVGWDDLTCVLALVGSAAHSGLIIYNVEHSFLGRHLWDIPIVKIDAAVARNNTALSLVYSPAVFLMKLSVLLLQKQLFGVNQIIRYLIYFGIAFQAVWAIVSIAVYSVAAAECTGIEALSRHFCPNLWKFIIVQGVINLATDIYILVLPVGIVLKLQLTRARRIGILAIFLTGSLAVAAGLARLIISIKTIGSTDLLWGPALTATLSCCEMNVGLICACMPAMPAFFKTHKLGLSALRERFSNSKLRSRNSSSTQPVKSKSFHGINVHITSPSFHLRTQDYVEMETLDRRGAVL